MKTPLTITVSAWNYCQNSCLDCVSGSNRPEWKFKGNFEIFSPPGCDHLNDQQLRAKWGADYYRRMCPDADRFLNKKDVMDFDCLIRWLLRFTPGARIHISGGEPLLRPDIETQVQKVIDAGFITTIFTNGMMIHERPKLRDMPLCWVVAHHPPNDLDKWRRNVSLIIKKRVYTTRVLHNSSEIERKEEIRRLYADFPFFFSYSAARRKELPCVPNPEDLNCIASGVLHLIVPDGRVYACNDDRHPPIGHILKMEYHPQMAKSSDRQARQCVKSNLCPAYMSALLTR